mgnify:CR=1 FL=1
MFDIEDEMLLPEAGHKGNSHMLMMDKNNLQIADLIIACDGINSARSTESDADPDACSLAILA